MENFEGAPSTGQINRDVVTIEDDELELDLPVATGETEASTLAQYAEKDYIDTQLTSVHPADVEEDLVNLRGMDKDTARGSIVAAVKPKIDKDLASGYSVEETRSYLKDNEYPDDLIDDLLMTKQEAGEYIPPLLSDVAEKNEVTNENVTELMAQARNVHELQMPFIKSVVADVTDDRVYQRKYKEYHMNLSYSIANTMRKLGHEVTVTDKGVVVDANGKEVDESFVQDIAAMENELISAVGLGIIAVKGVEAIPGFGKFGWLAKKGTQLAASVGGASVGASAGRALDVLHNSIKVKEELESKHIITRMRDAGVASATYDLIGIPMIAGGIQMIRGLGKGYDLLIEGNKQGAYTALKDLLHVDDSQVDEIIRLWEKNTGETVEGITRAKRALQVVPLSVPGAETIVAHAAGKKPKSGFAVSHMIDNRAKDLLFNTGRMTNDNIGTVLHDELNKYTDSVKDAYTGLKDFATDATKESKYAFDYDKLALDPLMERINTSLTNESVRKRFGFYMEQIRDIGNVTTRKAETKTIQRPFARSGATETKVAIAKEIAPESNHIRSFSDLLDLRKTINEFKSNTKIQKKEDFEAVKAVLAQVDGEIARVAKKEIPNGATWVKEWNKANIEYSKMFKLRKNVMYRALTRKGIDHKKIVSALMGRVNAIDGTFQQVLGKLPKRVREQTEGAVLDVLAKKHTIGFESGLQATHFPLLAEELRFVGFSSPKAREMKRAINEFDRVFKNDYALSRSLGQINVPGFQHYMTTNPVVRMQYEAASLGMDYVKRLLPGQTGQIVAMVTNVAKLIAKPTDSKLMAKIMTELPADSELSSSIRRLAIEYAKRGEKEYYPKVPVYRTGVPGSMAKTKDGPLGKGMYWNTSKATVKTRSRITGGKIVKERLLPSRIAVKQNIADALGVDDFDMGSFKETEGLVELLKNRGYSGVSEGDAVLMFKE